MDKLKAIFSRKSKKEPGPSTTAGTKTESNQTATATQVPTATKTDTAAIPSSGEPVAPAGTSGRCYVHLHR